MPLGRWTKKNKRERERKRETDKKNDLLSNALSSTVPFMLGDEVVSVLVTMFPRWFQINVSIVAHTQL